LDRALRVDLGGVVVPVVSPEDLVAMKVLAGRRKDFEDIRGVLIERGERLDLHRIHEVLASMDAVLGEGKLLLRFQRLWRQSRGKRGGQGRRTT
jgi:predicted nucleotidyltransferase